MLLEVDSPMLVGLIRGEWPEYELMTDPRVRMFGHYVGGMVDSWQWAEASNPVWDLHERQLYDIYCTLRLAHWGPKLPPPPHVPENPQDMLDFYRKRSNHLLFGKP